MFIFLIELLFLGILLATLFKNRLPNVFLALSAPLLGLISYAINLFALAILQIKISYQIILILISIEIFVLLFYQFLAKRLKFSIKDPINRLFLLVGVVYCAIIFFFFENNFSYASNDTLYLLIMSQNIVDFGFTKWYFASPSGMGVFIPILQTLGFVFGFDYTWFIQPLLISIFLGFFVYFFYRLYRSRNIASWLTIYFILLLIGVMVSSNLILAFTTYIHTNFVSSFFLFLSIITILNFLEDQNESWLYFSTLFLTIFGFTRVENIIYSMFVIMIFIGDRRFSAIKILKTFVPFLAIQFVWYLIIYGMKTKAFTDQMSPIMILVVAITILFLILVLYIVKLQPFKTIIKNYYSLLFPTFLAGLITIVSIIDPNKTLWNVLVSLENMFFAGNWGAMWWFVMVMLVIVTIYAPKTSNESNYLYLITSFFLMVIILGSFRDPYHINRSDSANRMFIHILPIIILYIFEKIALWLNKPRDKEMSL